MCDNKPKITDIFNKYGIWAYVLIICVTCVLNRILSSIGTHIIIFIIYTILILVSIFNKKINSQFNIKEKGLALGILWITPFCITILLGGIYFSSLIQSGTGVWTILNNSTNLFVLSVGFFLSGLICYVLGYAYTKVVTNSSAVKNKDAITNAVKQLNDKLDDAKIDGIEDIRTCLNEIKVCVSDNEIKDKINSIDKKLDNQTLDTVLKLNEDLAEIKSKILKDTQVGYTVTCIPMRYDEHNRSFKMILIKNKSHEKYAWMFPGCHIEVSENHFQNDTCENLKSIKIVPNKVIVDKVKEEAGLTTIRLIDSNFEFVMYGDETVKRVKSCWLEKAPVFNYLFMVNETARCYKNMNHRCHYDFTYIGEYDEFCQGNKEGVVEIEFKFEQVTFSRTNRKKEIETIKTILEEAINRVLNNVDEVDSINQLCLDSIPQMTYNAGVFYKKYKNIK